MAPKTAQEGQDGASYWLTAPKMVPHGPRWPQRSLQDGPRRLQDGPSDPRDASRKAPGSEKRPKTYCFSMILRFGAIAPQELQKGPRWPQDSPKWAWDGPKTAQDGPKTAPREPQGSSSGLKRGPRRRQDGPSGLQEGPQEGSKRELRPNLAQGPLQDHPGTPPGPFRAPPGTDFGTDLDNI